MPKYVAVICLVVALTLAPAAWCAAKPIPIILDSDIGTDIDDAFALAFTLQSPELDVRAVVTSRYQAETRARLAGKIMQAFGRRDIPLASGGSDGLLNRQVIRPVPQFEL